MANLTIPQALALAVQHYQGGNLAQAEQLCRAILQADPNQVETLHLFGAIAFQVGQLEPAAALVSQALRLKPDFTEAHNTLGVVLKKLGRLQEAEAHLRQALHLRPNYADAHLNLGTIFEEQGKFDEAVASLEQALRWRPGFAEAYLNLGSVRKRQQRWQEAVASLREALRLRPNYVEAHNNLGAILEEQGQLDEAMASLREVLRLKPDFAEAYLNLGNIQFRQGKLEEAAASLRQALHLQPHFAAVHNSLGVVRKEQGQLEEAEASLRQAVGLRPDYAEAHNNLGIVLGQQGKLEEALASLRQALRCKPDYVEALNNLGDTLGKLGRFEEAVSSLREALRWRPGYAEAQNNLGNVLQMHGHFEQATAYLEEALRLRPDFAEVHNNLGNALRQQGKLAEAVAHFQQALHLKPDFVVAHSCLLFTHQYQPEFSLQELATAHDEFERRHAARWRASWQPHTNNRDPDRRLRLGLLSPDFYRHPVGYYLIRTLERLDPHQAAVICYSNRIGHDDLTTRFRAAATTWYDVAGWSDERLAQQIRADQIDLLFDLAGHTAQHRLMVLARKPAPVQLTWLGYEGTTGLAAIDYLLADHYLIPPEAEPYYRERVLCLPDGYVCYDPPDFAPPVSPLPAQKPGAVTFGSFNNPAKLNAAVLALWAKVLARLPQARLILKYKGLDDPGLARNLLERFASCGVAAGRVVLRGWSPHAAMLAQYQEIDLALDPFPFNGGVTTCEALWMGVPVITWPGATFASRHSLSHLSNVGLTETIARDQQDYVEQAVALAHDLPRLAALRARLREQMAGSPLCDGPRFARNLLQLLRQIWRQWVVGSTT